MIKPLNSLIILGIGAACLLPSSVAVAGPLTVSSGVSSATLQEDFSTVPAGVSASFAGNGVTIAESFLGLTVNDPGGIGFEFYSGSPTNPLMLDIGAATDGLFLIQGGGAGLAGGTGGSDIGEGVMALLFDFDIRELGLVIFGAQIGGTTTFFFYDQFGGLVDTVDTPLFSSLTFLSTQAFRGVAIQNTDPGGEVFGDLRFDAATIPEPKTLLLFGVGLVGLAFMRRRRRVV